MDLSGEDDLTHLLMLGSSSKKHLLVEGRKFTGKFGLGFKSCYLFTDEPWIYSDQMAFKISSGVIPVALKLEEQIELHQPLLDGGELVQVLLKKRHTIIRLKRSPDVPKKLQAEITEHFIEGAELLSIFASPLDKVVINGKVTPEISPLMNDDLLSVMFSARHPELVFLIVSKLEDHENFTQAVLPFDIKSGELYVEQTSGELKGSLTSLWVTVPLTDETRFPFYINERFNLSIGRNTLPVDEHNTSLMLDVAQSVERALFKLWNWRDQVLVPNRLGVDFAERAVISTSTALYTGMKSRRAIVIKESSDYITYMAQEILGIKYDLGHIPCLHNGDTPYSLKSADLVSEHLREFPLRYKLLLEADAELDFPYITETSPFYHLWRSKFTQGDEVPRIRLIDVLSMIKVYRASTSTLVFEPDFLNSSEHLVICKEISDFSEIRVNVRSGAGSLSDLNKLILESGPNRAIIEQIVTSDHMVSADYQPHQLALFAQCQSRSYTREDVKRIYQQRLSQLTDEEATVLRSFFKRWEELMDDQGKMYE